MDEPLRNSIWNLLLEFLGDWVSLKRTVTLIACELVKVPLDTVPLNSTYQYKTEKWLRDLYFSSSWHEKYNLLEFLVERSSYISEGFWPSHKLVKKANEILAREMSGYRFIQGELVPISNQTEVIAIEEAVSMAGTAGLAGARTHLLSSLEFLGRKPEPDYRNSIKEAISAVESTVKHITGSGGEGLNDALNKLSKRAPIHPALAEGFRKIYGYTSEEDGIRHAILDEPNVGFDEAKFMLVACSAFVYFLISKAEG
jgi:hypothetical protein